MITLRKNDWGRLQWSIALFVALSAAGTVIATIATKALDDAVKANRQALAAKQDAQGKVARARDEEQELREKIGVYQTLVARGIIGQEHRLDWIEKIRKIKQARKLIDVRYEIAPQKPIDSEVAPSALNGFDILSSPMKLDMLLLHENDLLDFLADLRGGVQGYVRVKKCDVARATGTAPEHGPAPQLTASCEVCWITIREKQ